MDYWKQIWDKKGTSQTSDLRYLDGFEDTSIDPEKTSQKIIGILKIKPEDKVLEVGCGAGMLAQYIASQCHYVGIDYSESMIQKHKLFFDSDVRVAEASYLPFKNRRFDKSFSFSVFHYFPNKQYVNEAIGEMKRVTKGNIFIGDLPIKSHRKEHQLFTIDDFGDGSFLSIGFYNPDRFNVLIRREENETKNTF